MTKASEVERTIREAAVRRLGAIDASIVRTTERPFDDYSAGEWFGLSVRIPGGSWQFIGRRRTRQELLQMVDRFDPQHLGGKTFGHV